MAYHMDPSRRQSTNHGSGKPWQGQQQQTQRGHPPSPSLDAAWQSVVPATPRVQSGSHRLHSTSAVASSKQLVANLQQTAPTNNGLRRNAKTVHGAGSGGASAQFAASKGNMKNDSDSNRGHNRRGPQDDIVLPAPEEVTFVRKSEAPKPVDLVTPRPQPPVWSQIVDPQKKGAAQIGNVVRAVVHDPDINGGTVSGDETGVVEHCMKNYGFIFSKIRPCIVVGTYYQHLVLLPCYTHGGFGLRNKNNPKEFISIRDDRKGHYNFSSSYQPLHVSMNSGTPYLSFESFVQVTRPISTPYCTRMEIVGRVKGESMKKLFDVLECVSAIRDPENWSGPEFRDWMFNPYRSAWAWAGLRPQLQADRVWLANNTWVKSKYQVLKTMVDEQKEAERAQRKLTRRGDYGDVLVESPVEEERYSNIPEVKSWLPIPIWPVMEDFFKRMYVVSPAGGPYFESSKERAAAKATSHGVPFGETSSPETVECPPSSEHTDEHVAEQSDGDEADSNAEAEEDKWSSDVEEPEAWASEDEHIDKSRYKYKATDRARDGHLVATYWDRDDLVPGQIDPDVPYYEGLHYNKAKEEELKAERRATIAEYHEAKRLSYLNGEHSIAKSPQDLVDDAAEAVGWNPDTVQYAKSGEVLHAVSEAKLQAFNEKRTTEAQQEYLQALKDEHAHLQGIAPDLKKHVESLEHQSYELSKGVLRGMLQDTEPEELKAMAREGKMAWESEGDGEDEYGDEYEDDGEDDRGGEYEGDEEAHEDYMIVE